MTVADTGGGDDHPRGGRDGDGGALALDDAERELVRAELDTVLPALSGERLHRYQALADAVDAGSVPPDLQDHLTSVVSLALQTARARQLYRAEGEKVLTGVYRRTPEGRELADHLGQVNAALRSVAGATLNRASVRMRTLGHFTVTLETDAAKMVLAVRPDNVNVESVSVGEERGG